MNITQKQYKWNGNLSYRSATKYIVLHHRAGTGDVDSIHAQHVKQGWTGIGYHYYIRLDGTIYTGRPEKAVGAHTVNYNNQSIGVCFEGNYETTNTMPKEQFDAGQALIQSLRETYPTAKVVRHRDLQATACPGQFFPFNTITTAPPAEDAEMTLDEAKAIVKKHAKLDDSSIQYLDFYKYAKDLIIKLAKGYIEK